MNLETSASGAMVVARWELLREWDNGNGKIDHWNLKDAEEQYRYVTDADARFKLMSFTLNDPSHTIAIRCDGDVEHAANESAITDTVNGEPAVADFVAADLAIVMP